MKNYLFVLVLVMGSAMSSFASADQSWTITSKDQDTRAPVSFNLVEKKVLASIASYQAFDKNLGNVVSWSCKVTQKTNANPFLDECVASLALPSDWCYYGSFKLSFGYDAFSGEVTSLNYVWTAEEAK